MIGRASIVSFTSIWAAVPNLLRPSTNFRFGKKTFVASCKSFGSAMTGLLSPLTTIAFRFFDPMTAPMPVRPNIRASVPPQTIPAIKLPVSPEGPIAATRALESVFAINLPLVSKTPFPHRKVALLTSAPSGVTQR